MKKAIILILGIMLLLTACSNNEEEAKITNFEECIAAGNPAMESYPRQCRANDQTFVEEIEVKEKETTDYNVGNPRPCMPEDREMECDNEEQTVCGWFHKSVFCRHYPCAETYDNGCEACIDMKVDYWTKGECPYQRSQ